MLDKADPSYLTLRRVDLACRDLPGYKGLLLDHLHISDQRFNAVVDIAGKSKLFTILVEDLATAQQVLEINKQLKGGVVNIYPLETLHLVERK